MWIVYLPFALFASFSGRGILFHAHGDEGHHVHTLPLDHAAAHGHDHDDHASHPPVAPHSHELRSAAAVGVLLSVAVPAAPRTSTPLVAPCVRTELQPLQATAPLDEERHRPRRNVREHDRGSGVRALLRSSHALLI